ncbi:uncharacterized protein TNCV_2276031 [Trichonephila clavipes]|nr:uncharacterized protein TNCV_2276031 [Trichonephila clavipes]
MHAQLIREKLRGEEKMLKMSRQAAREAHVKVDASLRNQEIIDVSVSYDGTWQKRNCVVAGRDMGVDSAEFQIWQKGHADECDKTFNGTSGAMEMHAALIMWRRSISDCQMRFVSMLSDGDSKTFQFLSDNKIYGSDIKIKREECLNHIAKKIGTSLRNKVKEWKVKKVTLGELPLKSPRIEELKHVNLLGLKRPSVKVVWKLEEEVQIIVMWFKITMTAAKNPREAE